MTENTDETECYCEQTELNGEQTCEPCRKAQATWAQAEATANAKTNGLIHYITGGDFL